MPSLKESRDTYLLQTDPADSLYHQLVDFALGRFPLVLLVLRSGEELTAEALKFLRALEPHLESRVKSSRWPGTELLRDKADLLHVRLETRSAQLLKAATSHLFGWLHPDLPEDLCVLREDRTPWLVTIAHEDEGYFLLSEWERRQLRHALPDLRVKRRVPFEESPDEHA